MTAWRAPSESENNNTLGDADGGVSGVTFGGSWPKVMVWPLTSELAHSTVCPAWIVILGCMKRISETDCKPPVVETSSPMPVTSRIGLARPGLADTVVSCDALYSSGAASYRRGHYLTKALATGGPTTPNGVLCRRLAPLPSQFHCELLPTYLYVLACSRVDFTSLSDVECAVSSRWSSPGCDGLRRKNVEQARVAALHALFMCLELATEKIRNRFHSAIYSRLCLPSISVEVPDGF